jgi:hypothetical protein
MDGYDLRVHVPLLHNQPLTRPLSELKPIRSTDEIYPELPLNPLITRCHLASCRWAASCARYVHRATGTHLTEHEPSLLQVFNRHCENFISDEPSLPPTH